jgi:hypothetical protein
LFGSMSQTESVVSQPWRHLSSQPTIFTCIAPISVAAHISPHWENTGTWRWVELTPEKPHCRQNTAPKWAQRQRTP